MSNLQKACEMSLERWIDSLPENPEKHKFSKKHNREMKKIINSIDGKKRLHFTKKTARAILVAAIILALAVTAFAIETSHNYDLNPFNIYTEFSVDSENGNKDIDEISLHYIPDGFSMIYDSVLEDHRIYEYTNENSVWFNVHFIEANSVSNLDTEKYECSTIEFNGTEYIVFSDGKDYNGVVCNKDGYYIIVDGVMNSDELLDIAENVY